MSKMCPQVLNECGEEIPRFVSHFLDVLPPVSFKHIDVSALLGKMQQINADIDYLKRTMGTQVAACETLREVSAKLDGRLTAVEGPCGPDATFSAACLSAVEIQLGPLLWPAGSFVRCYYEPRHPRGADGGPSGPEDAPRSQDEELLHGNDTGVPVASVGEDGMKASCSAGSDKTH